MSNENETTNTAEIDKLSPGQDDFWKSGGQTKKDEAPKSTELGDEEANRMDINAQKPLFKTAGKVKIVVMKLFKQDEREKDSKDTLYTPFFTTMDFEEVGGEGAKFSETYRGGRLYDNDGVTKVYIGPNSALGRLKTVCIEAKIEIGATIKTWADSVIGKEVMVQSQVVRFQGKDYEKNYVVSFV